MESFDYQIFYEKENLSSMLLDNEISMSNIYQNIKNKTFSFDEKGIKISYNKNNTFNLNYKGIQLEYVFEIPFKIKINDKNLDIININHLKYLIMNNYILNPKINCESCSSIIEYNINNLISHKNHDISIEEGDKYKRILSDNFEEFFIKEENGKSSCLGKTFETPEDFEINFKYYFKDYEIYKNKPFVIFTDEKRENFIDYFIQTLSLGANKIQAFFGQSGIGKSISVLTALKYIVNHKICGTLYLNMKCLYLLFKKKEYDSLKQIIIDEVPYLFRQRYNYYRNCINLIWHFSLENEDSIWELIYSIIEFINNIPKNSISYAFIFDQYKEEIDKNKKLVKIFNTLQNKKKNEKIVFEIITLSSMNNKDIKLYKTNYIQHELDKSFRNQTIFDMKLEELNDIFDISALKFEDEAYKEYFDLLGGNIKYYNILNNYFNNQVDINSLINSKKEEITNKIKSYYDCDSSKKNIINLLYFSTKTKYNLNDFLEIVQYVPYKYFDPKIIREKNKKGKKKNKEEKIYIKINFSFPLIEEIVSELIDYILGFELNIYQQLCDNNLIDGGARGYLFEKFITIHLNPKVHHPNNINYFKDVDIDDTITIKKFVPKDNEEIIKKKKLASLKSGTYLFTQKILTGKDLDILIVDIDKNNNSQIMAFQISIYKPEDEIFKDIELQVCFNRLKQYLNSLYDFKIEENKIYFSYIFDKTYKDKKKFDDMLNICKENKMAYILFDPFELIFYDQNMKEVDKIRNIVTSPYDHTHLKIFSLDDDEDIFEDFLKFIPKKLHFQTYHNIDQDDKKTIMNILMNDHEFKDKIENIEFVTKITSIQRDDVQKDHIYIGRTLKTFKLYIIYFSLKRQKFIHSYLDKDLKQTYEKEEMSDIYDKYKIIIKQ